MSQPFIALTDKAWFDYLASQATSAPLDEVNFWSPKSLQPLKKLSPGEPVFFRLKSPLNAIAGYGFFAHFCVLDLQEVWSFFTWKNGDPDEVRFRTRIGQYRGIDLLDPQQSRQLLGCTILRKARFWAPDRWLRWDESRGWERNIVRGKTEDNPERASWLLAEIAADDQQPPEELLEDFVPLPIEDRATALRQQVLRVGQGTFRARLLDAYDRRCAITGERTELVLDAAHIQPYLGPRSNHIQNGLLLTKEFHTLFDNGYVTVTPKFEVRVSSRLREEWHNGKRYYEFDGSPLRAPIEPTAAPSLAALTWHSERLFRH